jgi:hypothetical protein
MALLCFFAVISTANAAYNTIPLRTMAFDADGHKYGPIECDAIEQGSMIFIQGTDDAIYSRQRVVVKFYDPYHNAIIQKNIKANYYGNLGTNIVVPDDAINGPYELSIESLYGDVIYAKTFYVLDMYAQLFTTEYTYESAFYGTITRTMYTRECL